MKVNAFLKAFVIIQLINLAPTLYAATYAYVACQAGGTNGTINIIDTSTNTVINTITLTGANLITDIAIAPNNQYLYVTATGSSNNVQAVNLATNAITTISVGTAPTSLAITPNSKYVYVVNSTSNSFSVISTATNANIAGSPFSLSGSTTLPQNIAITPDGTMAFITDAASNTVVPITISTNTIGTPFTVGTLLPSLSGIAITPNSSSAYIASPSNNMVYPVTNLETSPTVGTGISVGTTPLAVIINPAGTAAYVTNHGTTTLSVINTSNNMVTNTVTVGTTPGYPAITPNGSFVYVPNTASTTVSAVNTSTFAVTTISSGISTLPIAIAIADSGSLDTTFGSSGLTLTPVSTQDVPQALAIQSNDEIVIAGSTQTTAPNLLLARYSSSGSLDTTGFNASGPTPGMQIFMVGSRTEGNDVAIQSADSKIVVAGFAIQSQTNVFLARYNTDGSPDTTGFNSPNGYITVSIQNGATANAIGVQSATNSHRIIAAGASVGSGSANFTLAGFTSAGVLDNSFGTNGITTTIIGVIAFIKALAIDSSDNIVVVGYSDNNITIARYTPTGTLDTTFNSSGPVPGILQPSVGYFATAYDVHIDGSGNIVVAGSANVSGINQSLLIRCTSSGVLDTSFNSTGYVITPILYGSEFYSLTIQPNGAIIGTGYAIGALNQQLCIARYLSNGTLDTLYGTGGITTTPSQSVAYVQDVGLQSTDDAVILGSSDGVFTLACYTS